MQALSDIKVLEIAHHVAGPYLGKLFADYGADVIKVENPAGGDLTRRMGPFPGDIPHLEKSGAFLYFNTNKRGISLNLKSKTGQAIVKELVKDVDVLIENFEPRVMPGLGLGYEDLKKVNPKLVMVSISNFGQTGPFRDFKATEIVMYAMGGPMSSNGKTTREPLKLYGNPSAIQVALSSKVATMAALRYARQDGLGQHIDVSFMDALVGSIDRRGVYILAQIYSGRTETFRSSASLGGIFSRFGMPCKNGYLIFNMGHRYWTRFCRWIGHPELLDHPLLQTREDRMASEGREIIDRIGREFLMGHTMAELMDSMLKANIPGGAIYTISDVVADPHFQSRDFFMEVDHPATGLLTYPGAPWRPYETPWQITRPAPTLGQHNEEVFCRQLGYSQTDLVRLRQAGII